MALLLLKRWSMAERRSVADMVGEFLRDAAVLIMVFAPLDKFVLSESLTWAFLDVIVALSSGLLSLGIGIERWRKT